MSVHYKVCFSTNKFVTLWTVVHQAPLCMGLSQQEYWSGLPCPPPGDLLNSEIEPLSSASPAMRVDSSPTEPPGKPKLNIRKWKCSRSVMSDSLRLFAAYQAPPSMGFSRQEYWSGLPFPSPGDLPDPGIEPGSPTL